MARFSDQDYREMPPEVLRSIIRENTHHRLEEPVYQALHGEVKPRATLGDGIRHLLEIWQARGLPLKGEDFAWAARLLELSDELKAGGKPQLDTEPIQALGAGEFETVKRILLERRSIRRWTSERVPTEQLNQIIEAGLCAPHACNLQTIRVLVIEDEAGLELFKKSEVKGGSAHIVVCQDVRPYECTAGVPLHNRLLDCGAAAQNMLLMAQALGLGAVWLTFSGPQEKALREYYQLPEHIAIQTYLTVGVPAESPLAPGRLQVQDVLLDHARDHKPRLE